MLDKRRKANYELMVMYRMALLLRTLDPPARTRALAWLATRVSGFQSQPWSTHSMSISPRGAPPGPLSTRNQSGRSERADGSGLRNPSRGVGDTPALAASRNKAQQEDIGRNQKRVMTGIDTATPGPLPAPREEVRPIVSGERRADVGNGR